MYILNMKSTLLKESIVVYIYILRWWCFSLSSNRISYVVLCGIKAGRTWVWVSGCGVMEQPLLRLCVVFLAAHALSLSLSPCPTLTWNRVLHWLVRVSASTPLAGCPASQSISHPTYCNASALSIRSRPHDESFMSQCQDAAETGWAPVARVWEQGVEEEEDAMLELYEPRTLFFLPWLQGAWDGENCGWKQDEHWQSKIKFKIWRHCLSRFALDSSRARVINGQKNYHD